MAYVAEVLVNDDDLIERMNRMRAWLDHQRCEPRSFRLDAADGRQAVRVSFKVEHEAAAFIAEFGVSLLSTPSTDAAIP